MIRLQKGLDNLVRCCTVRIQADKVGTGFFVAPGLILTCAHVVEKAKDGALPINIYWKEHDYPAHIKILLPDPYPDLALLLLDREDHPELNKHLCVYMNSAVEIGDELYGYGYTDEYPGGIQRSSYMRGPRAIDNLFSD